MVAKTQEGGQENTETQEIPNEESLTIVKDERNCRVSFTDDGKIMIVTMPISNMARVMAQGFIYELHDIVKSWYAEKAKAKKNIEIVQRDQMNKFSFKNGLSKLLRK